MKVLVGLSGGVDSSVAALILKEKGYDVIGATMSIWGKDGVYKTIQDKISKLSPKSHHGACLGPDEKEDIDSAKRICEILDIPFYVFDCAKEYEDIVLKNFRSEYLQGKTPNPCIWCNALIKFDVLPKLAQQHGIVFDKFATGHYAKIEKKNNRYLLKRGIDFKKDQSYFLYRLKQEQLKNILLPLGELQKSEIRNIAKEHNLPVAEKPDSQDFYEGDYNELLQVKDKIGNIVDAKGNILGKHKGIWNYTIGQRKGLGISSTEALYVTELRKETNEVVVDIQEKTFKNKLIATNMNYISVEQVTSSQCCRAKIRSTQEPQNVIINPIENGNIEITFENMQKSISPGQSVVLYDGEYVIGGGIIDKVL